MHPSDLTHSFGTKPLVSVFGREKQYQHQHDTAAALIVDAAVDVDVVLPLGSALEMVDDSFHGVE